MNARGTVSRACTRVGQTSVVRPISDAERNALVSGLGVLLRTERVVTGWSFRRLARAVGCAPSTLWRIETGRRRPSEGMLRCIASVVAVDDPRPLADRLVAAAGASLVADTPGSLRRRRRLANAALLAGHKPLPTDLARRMALHRRADALYRQAFALIETPAVDDLAGLYRIGDLLAESRRLRAEAGPPITLMVGRRQIHAGWIL